MYCVHLTVSLCVCVCISFHCDDGSDYLDLIHGFYHVDGDLPLRTADQPEMKAVVKKYLFEMKQVIEEKEGKTEAELQKLSSEDLKAYEAYWGPFQQVQVDSALQAAKTHKKVVITFAQGVQICRDYVMEKLKQGGATNVTMLYLTIDQDTRLEGLYHRVIRQAKAAGLSLSEISRSFNLDWAEDRDPTMDEFKAIVSAPGKFGNWYFEPPPSYATVVDVSSRDEAAMDAIDAALGLHRASVCADSYETIVTKVRERDLQRDAETPYSTAAFAEIKGELEEALASAKTEDEKVHIKRRASSIVEFELKHRLSLASTLSGMVLDEDEDGDDGNDKNSKTADGNKKRDNLDATKLAKNRRASFIRTGKIE